jgi:hypothetical protein
MAKAKYQSDVGGSLKALSEKFGLPTKDNSILQSTKGKRYVDFLLEEMRDMAQPSTPVAGTPFFDLEAKS